MKNKEYMDDMLFRGYIEKIPRGKNRSFWSGMVHTTF